MCLPFAAVSAVPTTVLGTRSPLKECTCQWAQAVVCWQMVTAQLSAGGVGGPGLQCLTISRVKIFPPWLISRYQCGITECVLGLH